jgi:hypothetical protein
MFENLIAISRRGFLVFLLVSWLIIVVARFTGCVPITPAQLIASLEEGSPDLFLTFTGVDDESDIRLTLDKLKRLPELVENAGEIKLNIIMPSEIGLLIWSLGVAKADTGGVDYLHPTIGWSEFMEGEFVEQRSAHVVFGTRFGLIPTIKLVDDQGNILTDADGEMQFNLLTLQRITKIARSEDPAAVAKVALLIQEDSGISAWFSTLLTVFAGALAVLIGIAVAKLLLGLVSFLFTNILVLTLVAIAFASIPRVIQFFLDAFQLSREEAQAQVLDFIERTWEWLKSIAELAVDLARDVGVLTLIRSGNPDELYDVR